MKQLFGYIFDWVDPARDEGRNFFETIQLLDLNEIDLISSDAETDPKKWTGMWFYSRRPLLGEEPRGLDTTSEFRYRIFVRSNAVTGSIIIAAQRYAITDAALEAINKAITPDLRRRVININNVVQHLFLREAQQYAITYLMADVPGHRPFVSTIALHGEDIGASNFLVDERETFTARQLGVRAVRSRVECGRFSNSGSIQFNWENRESLERFLAYTYRHKFYIA